MLWVGWDTKPFFLFLQWNIFWERNLKSEGSKLSLKFKTVQVDFSSSSSCICAASKFVAGQCLSTMNEKWNNERNVNICFASQFIVCAPGFSACSPGDCSCPVVIVHLNLFSHVEMVCIWFVASIVLVMQDPKEGCRSVVASVAVACACHIPSRWSWNAPHQGQYTIIYGYVVEMKAMEAADWICKIQGQLMQQSFNVQLIHTGLTSVAYQPMFPVRLCRPQDAFPMPLQIKIWSQLL